MSSTNRGAERSADDYYSTPAWCVDALLRRIGPLDGKRILEPSAGTGGIVRRLLAAGARPESITAIEIDPGRAEAIRRCGVVPLLQSFESLPSSGLLPFDLIVMNPPFFAALEHIERAISLLATGGLCCALERLAFGASKKRAPFRARYPYDKLELAQRPSFATEERIGGSTAPQGSLFAEPPPKAAEPGETDSADYAWFCFGSWRNVPLSVNGWAGSECGGRFEVLEDGPCR